GVQGEMQSAGAPAAYKQTHEDFKSGVALMLEGVDLFVDALNYSSMAKGQEAQQKFQKANDLFSGVKRVLTGG
ncbi:MAG: hypothetical protein ACREDU_08685, partial [Methylocella sp.]